MEDEVVVVVALDKGTGFVKTSTSCDRSDAQHHANYYRRIGYNARVLTYGELEELQEKEREMRNYAES